MSGKIESEVKMDTPVPRECESGIDGNITYVDKYETDDHRMVSPATAVKKKPDGQVKAAPAAALTCPGTPRVATICMVDNLPPGNRFTDSNQHACVKSPDVEQQPILRNPCDDN